MNETVTCSSDQVGGDAVCFTGGPEVTAFGAGTVHASFAMRGPADRRVALSVANGCYQSLNGFALLPEVEPSEELTQRSLAQRRELGRIATIRPTATSPAARSSTNDAFRPPFVDDCRARSLDERTTGP